MSPSARGTLYCILSAVSYAMMGICQRELSGNCDPVWVNCVQALVSTSVFGIFLILTSVRGRSAWPPLSVAAGLIVLGIITQLGGSSYQWSLGVVGLAIGSSLNMGVMLAGSALLGLLILGERVSRSGILAIVLITAAIFLLGHGAKATDESVPSTASTTAAAEPDTGADTEAAPQVGTLRVMLGIAAACFAGVAFAILTVGVRKTATEETAPEAIVFYINAMGIVFLGPWAVRRLGLEGMMATSPRDFVVMLAIGVFNLFGFLLLTKALQLSHVVRVNIMNSALTIILSVLAGIVIFVEPANRELVIGILLIIIGMVLISIGGSANDELSEQTSDESSVSQTVT